MKLGENAPGKTGSGSPLPRVEMKKEKDELGREGGLKSKRASIDNKQKRNKGRKIEFKKGGGTVKTKNRLSKQKLLLTTGPVKNRRRTGS